VGFLTVSARGRILWMNRTAQRTLGLDLQESEGRLFANVVRDPQLAAFWQQALETEEGARGAVCMRWPRRLDLKVTAATALDASGKLIGRALMFCDLTNERRVQVHLSQEATRRLLNIAENWNESAEAKAGLTGQELKILRMVGAGLANGQIANQLQIAVSTVRTHMKHVYSKLGLASRSDAISYALRNGLSQ